jgi:hypothetical protein
LRVSTASFELLSTAELVTFLDKYWTPEKYNGFYHVVGIQVLENNLGKFWGLSKPENIIYDPESQTYSFDASDWIKFLFETKGQNHLPDYALPNLGDFMTDNLYIFGNERAILVGGMSLDWDANDYNFIFEPNPAQAGNLQPVSIRSMMNVEDMFVEAMKYYGAYMYYDGDKTPWLRSRNQFTDISLVDIDSDIISGSLSRAYTIRDYDSLLISVEEDEDGAWPIFGDYDPTNHSQRWVLVWWGENELQSLEIQDDENNIPAERKYLDLRQEIPYKTTLFRLFEPRTAAEVYSDYGYLLKNAEKYNVEVLRTDLSLGNRVRMNDIYYIVRSVEIDYGSLSSKLLLERQIG